MNFTTFKIKGKEWKARFLTKKTYTKTHGDDSSGITLTGSCVIDFNKNDINLGIIKHELLHAFVKECNTESANLTSDQMEELCCSIICDFNTEIQMLSEKIMNDFLDN